MSAISTDLLPGSGDALERLNITLMGRTAAQRVEFALDRLPSVHVLSSSFGAQAAVALHLVTRVAPQIPVILIDTGYLFPETYRFIDQLQDSLQLNLQVRRASLSPGWLEARHGRLWEQGLEAIERYNQLTKLAPMQSALTELGVGTWISGIRRSQARTRAQLRVLEQRDGRYKLSPLFDWTDQHVGNYLKTHSLPYHPLWDRGFVSIGDWHMTRSLSEAGSAEATRFFGLMRECGLHGLDS